MMTSRTGLAAACALAACGAAQGDFSGPYAPDLWTFTTEAGGFIDKHTADTLILVGGDSGFGGDTDLTITALAGGLWTFNWQFVGNCGDIGGIASAGFDSGYYLINGIPHFLGSDGYPPGINKVSVAIEAGDVIGFRVETVDGIFGPGVLTITNFNAPVPGPGAIGLLSPLLIPHRRRRCRMRARHRRFPCNASPGHSHRSCC